MKVEEFTFYKDLLITEKNEIIKEIMEVDESARNIIENEMNSVNDSADEAANNITQNILNIVNNTSKKNLVAIDAALKRIEEKIYGQCISCGKEIEKERLKAIPWATMCIACKSKNEKKRS
ncbi:MAG: TraR/DksA family transcriptional regulator [Spirochaetes bacterium]|nr:TraR/DksA family transcriptional regulator [Spirochaetota bacterium]